MKDDKIQNMTLPLPYPSYQTIIIDHVKKIKNSIFLFFSRLSDIKTNIRQKIGNPVTANKFHIFSKIKRPFKKFLPLFIFFIIVLPVVLLLSKKVTNSANSGVKGATTQKNQNNSAFQVKAKNFSRKEFVFPINNSAGKKITEFKYSIESAELLSEIYVKGQKATALKDKLFLIVDLKLVNEQKQGISVNCRDYIRLSVNKKNEWLAPDIHNDPVEIQAISTKHTRLGFIVNTSDTNPVLQVGEIDGPKQKIELNF